jgi:hypothetical protein
MFFPRTLRLDGSDTRIYERAAESGELAVPGAFAFLDCDPHTLTRKRLQAFAHGFLGTVSFGWSTLVIVSEISETDFEQVIDHLANHFVAHYGAPGLAAALPVAREEAVSAAGMCEYKVNTLLAVEREFSEDGIVERFKVIRPPSAINHEQVKIWGVVDE